MTRKKHGKSFLIIGIILIFTSILIMGVALYIFSELTYLARGYYEGKIHEFGHDANKTGAGAAAVAASLAVNIKAYSEAVFQSTNHNFNLFVGFITIASLGVTFFIFGLDLIWRYKDLQEKENPAHLLLKSLLSENKYVLSNPYTSSRDFDAFIDRVRLFGYQQAEHMDFVFDSTGKMYECVPHYSTNIQHAKKLLSNFIEVITYENKTESYDGVHYIVRANYRGRSFVGVGSTEALAICQLFLLWRISYGEGGTEGQRDRP